MERRNLSKAFTATAAQLASRSLDRLIDVSVNPAKALARALKNPPVAVLFGADAAVIYLKGVTSAAIILGVVPAIAFASHLSDAYRESAVTRRQAPRVKPDYRSVAPPNP